MQYMYLCSVGSYMYAYPDNWLRIFGGKHLKTYKNKTMEVTPPGLPLGSFISARSS